MAAEVPISGEGRVYFAPRAAGSLTAPEQIRYRDLMVRNHPDFGG